MIKVSDLAFSYHRDRVILENIAFHAPKGECTAVLGNNGAGKSTLIKCLNRILEPRGGTVLVDGKDVALLRRSDIAKCMAYVAQRSTGERFTVFDSVLLGRKPHIRLEPGSEDIRITEAAIRRMGLEGFALRYVDELSGGELQKVMLARALAQQPRVLLLDEPTSNLDLGNQYEVLAAIRALTEAEQLSSVIVIHDLNLALRYCHKFLFVKDRGVFAYGGREVITPVNIRSVYGVEAAVETVRGVQVVVPLPEG